MKMMLTFVCCFSIRQLLGLQFSEEKVCKLYAHKPHRKRRLSLQVLN